MMKRRIPEDQIWRYFIQVVLGIQALHGMKILHRDIKPGNIMVFEDGMAKVRRGGRAGRGRGHQLRHHPGSAVQACMDGGGACGACLLCTAPIWVCGVCGGCAA